MAFANEYRQFDPYAQPGFVKGAANPSEQGAYVAGAAQGAQMAYEANQRRLAAQQAVDAQQKAAGSNTYANVSALKAELQQNQAEIVRLQKELAEINSKYGDQDQLDRTLAANRARVGDIGNSRAHQQDIQNRMQWRWQINKANSADKEAQKKADIKSVTDKLDSAYSEFAWADTEQQKQVAQNKINRLSKEYTDLTGQEFQNPFAIETGVPNAGEQAKTLDAALAKYNNSKNDKGLPTEAAKAEALKDLEGLPFSGDLADKYNEIKNAKTQESAAKGAAAEAEKDRKALSDFKNSYSYDDLVYKANEGKLPTESNGRKVTVTRNADNSFTVKCGKQKVVINGNK